MRKVSSITFGILGLVLFIFLVSAIPQITVNSPPSSPFYTTNASVELNFSIIESNLASLIYNWNGTNFTMYNDSLVLMMNFENISALGENTTRIVDISNYGNNGTVSRAIWNSSGKYGGAYNFNGSNNVFINISNSASLNSTNFTISAWIKATSWRLNSWEGSIVNKDTIGISGFFLRTGSNGKLSFGIGNTSGGWSEVISGSIMSTNIWYNVMGIYNGTTISTFINGALINTALAPNYQTSNSNIFIGSGYDLARTFNGLIDEVRIWNRSLSTPEIYQQYVSNLQKFNSTQWYLYVNQSQNVTTRLANGTYTYQTFATDTSGNLNSTAQETIIAGETGDPNYPIFSNYSDNNGTLNNSGTGLFNITILNTNGTVFLEINGTNITATNFTNNNYNTSYSFTANGTYSYKWHSWGNGSSRNYNVSETRNYTVNYLDTNYPTFSNYSDNNATLTGSGIALFNVTVTNTNGTVWILVNNTNYTAFNLTSNIYNVSVNLVSAGTYNYTWYAHGNGATKLLNSSEIKYYTISSTSTTSSTETATSSNGGGGDYILVYNSKTEELRIQVRISPNGTAITKIKQDKSTGIKEIELKSKNWLSGEIFVVAYNETPDFCSIKYKNNHKVYKVLDFNNTLEEDSIDYGRLRVGIQKDWIYSNNISEIKFVRCYPEYDEVKSSYSSETQKEGIYDVYINGFSAYAILGTFDFNNVSENEKIWNTETRWPNLSKIILWVSAIVIIIGLLVILAKHRVYLKEKIRSKFFEFDFEFRIGRKQNRIIKHSKNQSLIKKVNVPQTNTPNKETNNSTPI